MTNVDVFEFFPLDAELSEVLSRIADKLEVNGRMYSMSYGVNGISFVAPATETHKEVARLHLHGTTSWWQALNLLAELPLCVRKEDFLKEWEGKAYARANLTEAQNQWIGQVRFQSQPLFGVKVVFDDVVVWKCTTCDCWHIGTTASLFPYNALVLSDDHTLVLAYIVHSYKFQMRESTYESPFGLWAMAEKDGIPFELPVTGKDMLREMVVYGFKTDRERERAEAISDLSNLFNI